MVLKVDLLRREYLIPAFFPVLLQAVEVVPRIEVEKEFFLGALVVIESPGRCRREAE